MCDVYVRMFEGPQAELRAVEVAEDVHVDYMGELVWGVEHLDVSSVEVDGKDLLSELARLQSALKKVAAGRCASATMMESSCRRRGVEHWCGVCIATAALESNVGARDGC